MPMGPSNFRALALQGFAPTVVRTRNAAHELAEMRFTRLGGFEFENTAGQALVSSGMRNASRSLCLVASSGHRIWLREEEKIFCLFPYHGTATVEMYGRSATAGPSEMIVVGPGERRTHLSRDYLGGMIQIPLTDAKDLDYSLNETGGLHPRNVGLQLVTASSVVASAHTVLALLEANMGAGPMAEQWLRIIRPLWEAMSLHQPTDAYPSDRLGSLGHVRMAEAYMDAHKAGAITISDVARAVQISPRALQLAFKRHRRSPPLQFLFKQRLVAARDLLTSGNPAITVTDVALGVGFTHLGRFSVAYRMAFGEHPSETRRRSTEGSADLE